MMKLLERSLCVRSFAVECLSSWLAGPVGSSTVRLVSRFLRALSRLKLNDPTDEYSAAITDAAQTDS